MINLMWMNRLGDIIVAALLAAPIVGGAWCGLIAVGFLLTGGLAYGFDYSHNLPPPMSVPRWRFLLLASLPLVVFAEVWLTARILRWIRRRENDDKLRL